MNRMLKALGLAFVTILALTSLMASGAQAQFTSTAENTTISGSQTEVLKFTQGSGVGSIVCETATFHGTQVAKSAEQITIKPTYGPTCTDSLGRVVHILKNTLEYHFLSGAAKGKVTLTGELVQTVTGSTHCTMVTQGHQALNGFTYTSNADGTVTVTANTNNVTSTISGGFFACGTGTTHSATGTINGRILLKGESGGNAVSISVD